MCLNMLFSGDGQLKPLFNSDITPGFDAGIEAETLACRVLSGGGGGLAGWLVGLWLLCFQKAEGAPYLHSSIGNWEVSIAAKETCLPEPPLISRVLYTLETFCLLSFTQTGRIRFSLPTNSYTVAWIRARR